jgi:MYXO-CTERM domain-containing protein
VLPDANATCGVEYCSESADTKAPRCNGNATCVMPPPLSCDPYRCDPQGSTCLTSCEMDSDCAPGLVCNNGGCSQPMPVPDAGVTKDAGTVDGSIGAGGASAGGASSVDAGTRGSGGSSSGGKGGGPGSAGTGTSGAAGTVGIPSPDGGVIAVDAGVDGGARPGGKHNNEHDSGGCGCRVTGTRAPDGAVELAAIGLAAMLVRRRRRRAPAQYRM